MLYLTNACFASRMRFLLLLIAFTMVSSAVHAALPTKHPYQKVLRDWIGSLTEEDLTVDLKEFKWVETAYRNPEDVFRHWTALSRGIRQPSVNMIVAKPSFFLLKNIEKKGVVFYQHHEDPAWWVQLDIAGNPHFASKPVKLRAAVSAAVDMIMHNDYNERGKGRRSDFLGGTLHAIAYTYYHVRDALPGPVQNAFKEGILVQLGNLETWGPTDINSNMDTKTLPALVLVDRIFGTPAIHKRTVAHGKRVLFGRDPTPATADGRKGIFHAAGYIGEMDGPETSYNGIALYYLVEAAMLGHGDKDWDSYMPEVIDRMTRFKAYNYYPDPDGRYEGPSSWAKRTNAAYPYDQRARRWRDLCAGLLSDHGKFLFHMGVRNKGGSVLSLDEMRQDIRYRLQLLNSPSRDGSLLKDGGAQPKGWKECHWRTDLPYAWECYIPGSYKAFMELVQTENELIKPPCDRYGDHSETFENEFWVVKDGDWGFQVESVPNMGRGYTNGGLAGGSLAAFWTRDTGVVILGKLPNKFNYVTYASVETWPTHHIWGRTGGKPFSSARNRRPTVTYDLKRTEPSVVIQGPIAHSAHTKRAPGGAILEERVTYKRSFRKTAAGLKVTSAVTSTGKDKLTELWESIPVYLRDARRQAKLDDALIEFHTDQTWVQAGSSPQPHITAVRITRFGKSVVLTFDKPRRVRLTKEPYQCVYQIANRHRNIMIDLLEGAKRAHGAQVYSVSYLIKPSDEVLARKPVLMAKKTGSAPKPRLAPAAGAKAADPGETTNTQGTQDLLHGLDGATRKRIKVMTEQFTSLPEDKQEAELEAARQVIRKRVEQAIAAGQTLQADLCYGGVRDTATLQASTQQGVKVAFSGALVLVGQVEIAWKDFDAQALASCGRSCVKPGDVDGLVALSKAQAVSKK